ncbi:MAG: GDSL-type esterase/lipase family protein [Candidatus Paceibacterota bacterium]
MGYTKIITRNGTTAEWTAADPVLALGEVGADTDIGSVKVGDGASAWSVLPFVGDASVTGALTTAAYAAMVDAGELVENVQAYVAALDDMDANCSFVNSHASIVGAKTLKIAFVGDSITEGANVLPDECWVERFISKAQEKLPGVTITYENFALGGRTLAQFIDPAYVAVNPETSYLVDFWRDWSTVGKSWCDHVADYEADLTVIAFGMNDTGGTGADFVSDLADAITAVTSVRSDMDIALVSTILPTVDKVLYPQDEDDTQNLARIMREYAIQNGYGLIDANRLWKILRYGEDECRFYTEDCNDISEINAVTDAYWFEAEFVMSSFPAGVDECDFYFGVHDTDECIMRMWSAAGVNYVTLYTDAPAIAKTWTITGSTVAISVKGASISVNGVEHLYYDRLYNGAMDATKITAYVTSVYVGVRHPVENIIVYSELQLLGAATTPLGLGYDGNGVNHPTSLGNYLSYYMASMPVIRSLCERQMDFSITTALSLQNSWANLGAGYATASFTMTADRLVKLQGIVNGGTTTRGTTICTLPAGYRPAAALIFATVSGDAFAQLSVNSAGQVIIETGVTGWISLDTIVFKAS